jgi:tRNA modification GTPase
MEGALSKRIGPFKERLIDVIARAEAGIDFVEDELDPPDGAAIVETVREIVRALVSLEESFAYGRLLNRGLRLVIAGKPNVGKSSLFNRLVSSERAIVTDTPGTTRDVLTETVNVEGVPLLFCDTAGIRETTDPIESIGVGRSMDALADADLALVVLDGSAPSDEDDDRVLSAARRLPCVVVVNKCDLPQEIELNSLAENRVVRLSALSGAGMADLDLAFREFLADRGSGPTSDAILTNTRQHEAVVRAIQSLETGARAVSSGTPHEMALLDFYDALTALGELTGEVSTDDILGRIFTTFCIGK